MLDADLAEMYGTSTKVLNQSIKRNIGRFPEDFLFRLTEKEKIEVVTNCDHLAKLKFSKALPFAFTGHGAIQAANVLASPQAVEMGVYLVRAFVRLRQVLASNRELASRLDVLEEATEALAAQHGALARSARAQFREVFDAIRDLMTPPEPPPKRPIGFVPLEEKPAKPKAAKSKG